MEPAESKISREQHVVDEIGNRVDGMPRRLDDPDAELPKGQPVPVFDVPGREIEDAGLVGVDARIVHLQEGPDAVHVRVVGMRHEYPAHEEPVAFHRLQETRVERSGVHEDGVTAFIRTKKVGVGHARGEKGEELHGSTSMNTASPVLERWKSITARCAESKYARVRLQSRMLTFSSQEPTKREPYRSE